MKASPGRIVHYVLSAGNGVRTDAIGQIRAAIIVRTWSQDEPTEGGCAVQLQVLLDGSNDHPDGALQVWATSVCYSEKNLSGTWHWPPRT